MLREIQAQELSVLLKGESFEWSILILDKDGQDIISPLFIMTDLMEMGIVQCLRMEDSREANLETRAIYFVKETEQNVARIIEDVRCNMYSRIEILFTGIVSTKFLRDLSLKLAAIKEANRVVKVVDTISTHSMLHDNIYTLNMENSFVQTARLGSYFAQTQTTQAETEIVEHTASTGNEAGSESAEEMEQEHSGYFEKIVLSLLSIFKNTNDPVIYHNHPISRKISTDFLDRLSEIREVQERKSPQKHKKQKRPLLIILNRNEDLVGPMYHTNSYGAMLNEIFEFNLNKLVIENPINSKTEDDKKKEGPEIYNLNRHDTFYNANINQPFTTVVDKVNEDLLAYKELSNSASINMSSGNDEMIKSLIKLPDLVGKNRLLYNHLNIVLNAIEVIKNKHLDELFSIEDSSAIDVPEVEEIIGKIDRNELIRLCAIISAKFSKQYAELSKTIDKTLQNKAVLNYIERNTVKHGMKSKIINNLKRMIGVGKDGIVRRIEEVYNKREEDYSSINVLLLGGGTYDEYKAVMDYGKSQNIKITYGSTEILSANNLIAQIEEIAQ
ncbi:sec1 family domain-containing protein 1 [Nematocida minor]|uniref:sec1 family domain-containing protein 1 n=1 Tax=Nematocida minor TaxID=1912983 RepID=UPI00221EB903|nr:sec1 family domain-containing protein 1 [Nematocida minor]KAI5191847.1 sec1 family domain-containing protein 1 [Nematocida minor]